MEQQVEEYEPTRDNVLIVVVYTTHLSIDIGMRNLGIFCLLVIRDTWEWVSISLLAAFDLCSGIETGGKKCTSVIAQHAVELLDALLPIRGTTRLFIEEQFIATGKGAQFMQNDDARRLEAILLGYFVSRQRAWRKYRTLEGANSVNSASMVIYRVPNKVKTTRCPKQLQKNKPAYKEWTRQQAVIELRERDFEEAASVVECASKGDDAGDAVMQYIEASVRVKEDATKYLW